MSNRTSGHPRLVLRCRGQARALAVRVVFAWSSLLSGFVCVCVCVFFSPQNGVLASSSHPESHVFNHAWVSSSIESFSASLELVVRSPTLPWLAWRAPPTALQM